VACTVPASPYSAITMATEVHAIFAVTYITYVVLRWGLIIQQHCIARVAQKRPKCQCPQSTPRSRVCDNHQLKLLWEVKVSKWSEDQNQLLIMMLRQHQMLETTVLSCSVEETKMSWLKHSHIRTISVLLGEEQGLEMVFRQRTRSWDHNTPVLSLTRTRSRGGVETENKVMRPQHTCVESEKNKVSRWCSGKELGVETTTHLCLTRTRSRGGVWDKEQGVKTTKHLCWVWEEQGLEVVFSKEQGVKTTTHLCWVWQEQGLEVVFRQRTRC